MPDDTACCGIPRHRRDERVRDRRVDGVEAARDLERRLLAEHADAVGLEPLASQRGGVEPHAVHVGVDEVGRNLAGRARRAPPSVGASGHSASRNPAPTRRPSGSTGAAPMIRAAWAAEVASPSGSRCAASAHCTTCTWWSHSPGMQPTLPRRRAPRPRRASAPAGAMSTISPSAMWMSTGSSANGSMPLAAGQPRVRDDGDGLAAARLTAPPSWRRGRAASRRPAAGRRTGSRPPRARR